MHMHMQIEKKFLDFSSLGAVNQDAIKIKKTFKKKNKLEFGSINPS